MELLWVKCGFGRCLAVSILPLLLDRETLKLYNNGEYRLEIVGVRLPQDRF